MITRPSGGEQGLRVQQIAELQQSIHRNLRLRIMLHLATRDGIQHP